MKFLQTILFLEQTLDLRVRLRDDAEELDRQIERC